MSMILRGFAHRRRSTWAAGLLALASSPLLGCSADPIPQAAHRQAVEAVQRDVPRDREWIAAQIESTYAERGYAPLWVGRTDLGRSGRRLLATLRPLEDEALPATYAAAEIQALRRRLAAGDATDEETSSIRAELEIRLSAAFLARVRDLVRGHYDPGRYGQDWRIRPEPLPTDALERVSSGESPDEILASLRPQFPAYRRLVESLRRLRAIEANGGWPEVRAREPLEPGDRSPDVRALRQRLAASEDEEERRLARRGRAADLFDEDLGAAVERFQRRHGLEPDRVVGPVTLRELRTSVEARIHSVEINLDRLRWMPRDLGPRAILVNVAGFELALLEDNQPRFSMDVVVGRIDWATRLFSATMDHLVLNPYWNVPEPILRDEVLPAVREDPGYAVRHGFQIVQPEGVLDPTERDWEALASAIESGDGEPAEDSWLRRVRQAPGPTNALGKVKFMFPNQYRIYLHDTPERELFQRSRRAFSHGCVRVERPVELARYLVGRYTSRPAGDVDRILESGEKEVTIPLDLPVEVYVVYVTAWADEDGTTYFHRDVYDRDAALHVAERVSIPPRVNGGRAGLRALAGPDPSRSPLASSPISAVSGP